MQCQGNSAVSAGMAQPEPVPIDLPQTLVPGRELLKTIRVEDAVAAAQLCIAVKERSVA